LWSLVLVIGHTTLLNQGRAAWMLARQQHGVVTRAQLMRLGFTREAISHRLRRKRLHRIGRGVYAVGRPELTRHGLWMAAVLGCGPPAVLSHGSAGALWEIRRCEDNGIEVSLPASLRRCPTGIVVHRRRVLDKSDTTRHLGIPVTTPVCTLVDLAVTLTSLQLEAAVNEADKLGLVDPETLRTALDDMGPRHGLPALRNLIDRESVVLTDSDLERRFLRLVRAAGLPLPLTGVVVNGFKVDF